MSRARYVWDSRALDWVPFDQTRKSDRSHGLQVIRDIDPYQAVASDIGAGGKRPVIGGRRQHREFLKRNGYAEVGNSSFAPKPDYGPRPGEIAGEIKRHLRD